MNAKPWSCSRCYLHLRHCDKQHLHRNASGWTSSKSKREAHKENDEHAKHLEHERPIARHVGVVPEQLPLRSRHIVRNVTRVYINALHSLALLLHHLRQLLEDAT